MKRKLVTILTIIASVGLSVSLVKAASLSVDWLEVGSQDTGGVAYLNGTILNDTLDSVGAGNPVTFGDNVRIDGRLYRGATAGPGDNMPLIVNDNLEITGDIIISGDIVVSGSNNIDTVGWNSLEDIPTAAPSADDTIHLATSQMIYDWVSGLGYISNDTSIAKDHLTDSGSLSFDWLDSEVADTLTVGAAGDVNWAALSSYPSGCGANQAVQVIGDTLTCLDVSSSITDYGELYVYNNADTLSLSVEDTWYKIADYDLAGVSNNVTVSTADDKLTVSNAGKFKVSAQISFSGSVNSTYETAVFVNGAIQNNVQSTRKLGTGGDVGTTMISGILDLSAADYVEVHIRCTDGGSKTITVQDSNLSIFSL